VVFKTGGNYPHRKKTMQNNIQMTWAVSLLHISLPKEEMFNRFKLDLAKCG